MPTGYTAGIEKGMQFKEFAMGCARAFGACVTMRDEPSDVEIKKLEPSDYHKKELANAEKELKRLKLLTPTHIEKELIKEYKEAVSYSQKQIDERNELNKKYKSMIANVKAWSPPSSDHVNLKEFMINQIEISIDNYTPEKVIKKSENEWITEKINSALYSINYHKEENQKEIDRTNERNLWITQLKDSLK